MCAPRRLTDRARYGPGAGWRPAARATPSPGRADVHVHDLVPDDLGHHDDHATTACPKLAGKGLPADLLATMQPLYLGGSGPRQRPRWGQPSPSAGPAPRAWRWPAPSAPGRARRSPAVATARTSRCSEGPIRPGAWSAAGGHRSASRAGCRQRPCGCWRSAPTPAPSSGSTGARADALHIIGVDAKGVGGIVGIPRDSWVPLSIGGSSKVNAALVFGGAKGQVTDRPERHRGADRRLRHDRLQGLPGDGQRHGRHRASSRRRSR